MVRLELDAAVSARQPSHLPRVPLDPHNPAYVIYTSGSTGLPKGVAMAHAGVRTLISWSADAIPGKSTNVAQLTPISFDVSAQEILSALIAGKTLVILRAELSV